MKIFYISFLILLQTPVLVAQKEYSRLPYKYNAFISRPDISWACEAYNTHEFDSGNHKPFNIYSYIINAQKAGKIKSYLSTGFTMEEVNQWKTKKINDYYVEINKEYSNQKLRDFPGQTNLVEYHEIFYWQQHKLKSQVVSAGPQLKVFTSSGIYIGNSITSFSSVNYYSTGKQNKKDVIIFLGNVKKWKIVTIQRESSNSHEKKFL